MGEKASKGKLGTFAGVFTPSILTILGLILFLRLSTVVGSVGLRDALVIILLANAISLFTSFSVAAIATGLGVKGGGDYYLISRTLGVGLGTAIGLVLFLAQSISVGFYCIGFAEAVAPLFLGSETWHRQAVAAVAIALLFGVAWAGADWATRLQYLIMALLLAALAAFFTGALQQWTWVQAEANWTLELRRFEFWVAFALFFPAVTGFTQGISMSGDLANPSRSIPRGTFAAVGLSFLVYFAAAAALGGVLPAEALAHGTAMREVAAVGALIDAGIIAATLSSALASFLGAPRILQALAADRVLPFLGVFAEGSGSTRNPRRALLLALAIALGIAAIGSLNLVALLVTMFFLISYGLLNYATFYEARAASPSFRPTLRLYRPWLSLIGSLGCAGCILAIDWSAGAVAIALVLAIQWIVERRGLPARWSDSSRAHDLKRARDHLLSASADVEHARDWRPQLLVLAEDAGERARLVRFAAWIEGGAGLTTVAMVLSGDPARDRALIEQRREALAAELREMKAAAFPLVVAAQNRLQALATLVQAVGTGPLAVNTVVAPWHEEGEPILHPLAHDGEAESLRRAFRLGRNLVVLEGEAQVWQRLDEVPREERIIDVWWMESATGRLMLLLAHLALRHEEWSRAKLRVLVSSESEAEGAERLKDVEDMLAEVRIAAEAETHVGGLQPLIERSRESHLVFLPMVIRRGEFVHPFGTRLDSFLGELPVSALVLAAEDVALEVDPDVADEDGNQKAEPS